VLLNAVIIILREVLEASLIIGVLLAFSQMLGKSRIWIAYAIILGLLGSSLYAMNIAVVSQWLDGVGQEVINANMHFLIYLNLVMFLVLAMRPQSIWTQKWITVTMVLGVMLAIVREGSEIMLYLHGFFSIPNLLPTVLLGGVIGGSIGISVGVLFYYILVNIQTKNGLRLGYVITILIAGGMILQMTQLLIQADWLISQYPIWNTTSILSEQSIAGQLLYALIGYEATPTPVQIISYISALVFMVLISIVSRLTYKDHQE
jgi:high-affinity iron transporter